MSSRAPLIFTVASAELCVGIWALAFAEKDDKPFKFEMQAFGYFFAGLMLLGAGWNAFCALRPSELSWQVGLGAAALKVILFGCFVGYVLSQKKLKNVWGFPVVGLFLFLTEGFLILISTAELKEAKTLPLGKQLPPGYGAASLAVQGCPGPLELPGQQQHQMQHQYQEVHVNVHLPPGTTLGGFAQQQMPPVAPAYGPAPGPLHGPAW